MVGDQAPDAKLQGQQVERREGLELIGHDVPFVDDGDQFLDVELDFFRSGCETHGDSIIIPSLVVKLSSQ